MKELVMNPYVIQIDKFVSSLGKLSRMFLSLEEKKAAFSKEELLDMCQGVCSQVCAGCSQTQRCLDRNDFSEGEGRLDREWQGAYSLILDIFRGVENYGTELNVEIKRNLQKHCVRSPRFLRKALELYKEETHRMMWGQKMALGREGYASWIGDFGQMILHAARELDASIFSDEPLERRMKSRFLKAGIRILTTVFLVTKEGRYEIHVTVKAKKGECIATKEVARMLSECLGRNMILGKEERGVLGQEYATIVCVEGPKYYTLSGVARIGKGSEQISGDSFSLMDLPGGWQGVLLSDGMGAGERARRESTMVVEVLEELLAAGFPKETALQMINTALVTGREELCFSTIDLCMFHLYKGTCEIVKAGACQTFLKRRDHVECISLESLPLGVLPVLEVREHACQLQDGDQVIMVTDGVMDALPVGEQELLMKMMIEGMNKTNPKEAARHILGQVLECSGASVTDDMTVLAVSIWSLDSDSGYGSGHMES